MPRLFSGKEVIRALVRVGFVIQRQRGSHVVLRRDEQVVVVPNHKSLETGTPGSNLRQASMTREELEALV